MLTTSEGTRSSKLNPVMPPALAPVLQAENTITIKTLLQEMTCWVYENVTYIPI